MTTYWLERAWLQPGHVADHVLVTVDGDRFIAVEPDIVAPPATAIRLHGLTIPGLANCHSHAFHRALRGRAQAGRGTFWTWREQMYAVAERLDPDTYYALARATYAEMAATGITAVGEFHYLHHAPDGTPYDDPNAMGHALIAAARDAGLRITLLDTCYLAAGIDRPVEGVQRRYSDGDAERWAARAEDLAKTAATDVVIGAAVHSVRAVPRDQMPTVAAWAHAHSVPLHFHLSEQVDENDACEAAYGRTPTRVLFEASVLNPRASAVHATHLADNDVALLGDAQAHACFCPTTERDLADGIGPSRRLHDAGCALTLGSDSHAVIDLFEEMRAVELDERLTSHERGHWSANELLAAATSNGHTSLGFPRAGTIAPGAWADLVTLDTRSPRTAGAGPSAQMAVFAATAADVSHIVSGGRVIDSTRVGRDLAAAIGALWEDE